MLGDPVISITVHEDSGEYTLKTDRISDTMLAAVLIDILKKIDSGELVETIGVDDED